MMDSDLLILVDCQDQPIGTADKLAAHMNGQLHRAFSVFLFNDNDEFLLQQRALGKYHTPGLWSNTCCSHPYDGETLEIASIKRLDEEMGISVPLVKVFSTSYLAKFSNGLVEHEIDHVFVGRFNGTPKINTDEARDWAYKSLTEIEAEIACLPHKYTPWFKLIYVSAFKYFKCMNHLPVPGKMQLVL